jgi:hypothetical protein
MYLLTTKMNCGSDQNCHERCEKLSHYRKGADLLSAFTRKGTRSDGDLSLWFKLLEEKGRRSRPNMSKGTTAMMAVPGKRDKNRKRDKKFLALPSRMPSSARSRLFRVTLPTRDYKQRYHTNQY